MSKTEIERILANANASLEMEGLKPSDLAMELAKKHLQGKIKKHEVNELIFKKYLIKK